MNFGYSRLLFFIHKLVIDLLNKVTSLVDIQLTSEVNEDRIEIFKFNTELLNLYSSLMIVKSQVEDNFKYSTKINQVSCDRLIKIFNEDISPNGSSVLIDSYLTISKLIKKLNNSLETLSGIDR